MPNLIVALRADEGGEDAKLLVEAQMIIYQKHCQRRGL